MERKLSRKEKKSRNFASMTKEHIITLLCLSMAALAAAQGEYVKFYYDNGLVSSEGSMNNGKPDGYWKTYYDDGGLKTEGNRKNYLLDSLWKFFRSDSTLEREITYREDLKWGEERVFTDKGVLSHRVSWERGVKQGVTRYYYPDGGLHKEINFVNNKEEGRGLEYSKSGEIITLLTYRNGFLYGEERINRSNEKGERAGTWLTWWTPGSVARTEGYYTAGKKNGVFKYYKKDGSLERLETYDMDQLVTDDKNNFILDIRREYDETGKVRVVGGYNKGMKQGSFFYYDENGLLQITRDFSRDVLLGEGMLDTLSRRTGPWKLYFTTGELSAEGSYVEGKREGAWTFYFKNGKVMQKGNYKSDSYSGNWKWYFADGTLRREENYRKGKEDGTSIEYDSTGVIIAQGEFISGLKNGKWFHQVNDHTEEGEYLDGERNGKWIWKYADGRTGFEGEYSNGLPSGKHRYWYADGITKMKGEYEGGELQGEWQYYDTTGVLTHSVTYEMGIAVAINGDKIEIRTKSEE